MRFILLTFALVAAATAVPQIRKEAANVDILEKQRHSLLLLQQPLQDTLNDELFKVGKEFDIRTNIHMYNEPNTVEYLVRLVQLRRIQPKGVPFTTTYTELRKEVALLTRTFLAAKDYDTFYKTAAWARLIFNQDQFYKAFVAACLQRDDTKGIIFPAPYEVFPNYYFDTRVMKKAEEMRMKGYTKEQVGNIVNIPVNHTAWLPMGEDRLTYFSQDIGLASWYFYFSLGGWMIPKTGIKTESGTVGQDYVCNNCETGRGANYYYVHQQLLARYYLERMSVDLWPFAEVDFTKTHTPFKPHLSYANGLEFPGRDYEYNMLLDKERLVKTVFLLETRLKNAIDKGFVMSIQGNLLSLYDTKGLDMLGTLIEGTGKSINPRYYGSLQAVARELLGGAPTNKHFWEPTPSVLEIQHTTTRDPVFYKLWKRIIRLFTRWQQSLPSYVQEDLVFPGVQIESVKFDELITYCEEFLADIDAATVIPVKREQKRDNFNINAVVDRLNHKPYTYEIIVNSDKNVKNAVVRVFIGPKCDFDKEYDNIRDTRLNFVEMDQFVCDLKEGKNVVVRNSIDAPMRSIDTLTKSEIYRKVEEALNSHEPFYPHKVSQMFGFPERLALPRGKPDGLPLQVLAIISPFEPVTKSYGPVIPRRYQTYHNKEFPKIVGGIMLETRGRYNENLNDFGQNLRDVSGENFRGENFRGENLRGENFRGDDVRGNVRHTTRGSGERFQGRSNEDMTHIHRGSRYNQNQDQVQYTSGEDTTVSLSEKNHEFLMNYYKNKHISEIVGGAISLDGKPFGYPLERPLSLGCLDVPNVKVVDVKVWYQGRQKCGGL